MNTNVKNIVNLAFDGNVSEMSKELNTVLMQKVYDALTVKRIETAQNMYTPEPVDAYEDLQELDQSYIEETLSVSDGVDAWIKDFVDSDDPRFEGKSKKERIQMALGAFYAAKNENK